MANTNATVKVTKAMVFSAIIKALGDFEGMEVDGIGTETMINSMEHELELLAKKKAGTSKTATKNAEVRNAIADVIIEVLSTTGKPMTVTEMQATDERLRVNENGELISTQRVTSVCYSLCEMGKITNTKEKKKSYFAIA